MSPLGAIYTPRGLLKLPVYPPFRLAVPSLATQPSPYLSTGVPVPATVHAAAVFRLPATTVSRPVFWLILRTMLAPVSAIMMLPLESTAIPRVSPPLTTGLVAPKLAWVAGHPLPILSVPVAPQTVVVPPPTVVMV